MNKRVSFPWRSLGLLALALGAAGCANVDRTVAPGRDPAALTEIFVATNLNDHRGLGRRLAAALRERGLEAEAGPETMRPESAEAVLRYDDRWAWDFGEHMIWLRITLSDPKELRPYATATRQHHVARSTRLDEVIPDLVGELLAPIPSR